MTVKDRIFVQVLHNSLNRHMFYEQKHFDLLHHIFQSLLIKTDHSHIRKKSQNRMNLKEKKDVTCM